MTGAAAELNEVPCVSLRGFGKTFGGRKVLDGVDLDVLPGRVHALIGQNGSGKSTLIKILASFHAPDAGAELWSRGERVPLPLAPTDPDRLGIAFVHQDLALFETGSVFENIRLGRYRAGLGWRVSWRRERRLVVEALERFGLAVKPDALIATLPPVDRAQVAIVRALERLRGVRHGLLVLDEPTPHLPRDGVEQLFANVRRVTHDGTGVLFVTHRLDEVMELSDEVTVLRNGLVVGRAETAKVDTHELTSLLLGFSLEALRPPEAGRVRRGVALGARGVTGGTVRDVIFDLHEGEILGVTGLLGMGWDELAYVLYDGRRASGGEVELPSGRRPLRRWKPHDAIAAGVVLVPADRLRDSVVAGATVRENLTIPWIGRFFRRGVFRIRRERAETRGVLRAFDVRPPEGDRLLGTLSGGNQQKLVVARWFETKPRVLLLHEPTQGVDVGARREIYRRLREAASQGLAVLLASGEFEDLAYLCDRVLIFRDGRVVATLEGEELTYERIVERSFATSGDAAPAAEAG